MKKIKIKIVFKSKTGYKLESLSPETMKLLGSTKRDFDQNKDGEHVPKFESSEVVLILCNLVNKNYQQASTFVPNEQFGQLITIVPHLLTILNTTNTKILSNEVWFTDQSSKQLETEDNFYITVILV